MKHKVPAIILTVLLSILALAAAAVIIFWNTAQTPVHGEADGTVIEFSVPSGMTVSEAAEELESLGLVRSARLFYAGVRYNLFRLDGGFILKSGEYSLTVGSRMRDIAAELEKGRPVVLTKSIPEGLTIKKTALTLEESGICPAEDFAEVCHDSSLLAEYGIPASSFEGYIFPDTYFFNPDTPAETVLRKLVDTFFEKIAEIPALDGITPEELHQKVILASIIEREYRAPDEAPVIASVFTNRLRDGIGLQSCATVEYIITEIDGKPHPTQITYADLKSDSPYNTYMWRGLPPGPISNPGMVALNAAASPADTDYYFFVLTDPDAGTHTFSRTFDEHKIAENAAYYTKN